MFFPQLVAGPIERPQNLLGQFYKHHQFEYDRVMAGLKLMAWGMLKKVVIADRLAVVVNMVYDNPHQHCGVLLIIATIFFAFQIYTDFSGYSDIARGAAQVLGFKLMFNFRNPYLSQSVSEFWRRWHISLSSWFKDYVYIPLGGNRVSEIRRYANLLVTFTISGLWHGASWNFVIWGFINGLFVCAEVFLGNVTGGFTRIFPAMNRLPLFFRCVRVGVTFLLICCAWVFFRASTFGDACYILTHLFSNIPLNIKDLAEAFSIKALGLSRIQFFFAAICIIILIVQNIISESFGITKLLEKSPLWSRWILNYILIMTIIVFGYYEKKIPFIYFQF
jgi:D-alanyl-lipoteichoic acid acyltransferase DltB (MBOAT superfamily)